MTSKNNNNVEPEPPVIHLGQGVYSRYMTQDGRWHTGDPEKLRESGHPSIESEETNDSKEEDNKEDYKPGDNLDITA